ncbi:alpha/beta hydrolase [Candidatus Parcubacteria bacterium]|nr:alpha/beta hydrolase [Candidatus Parcubacteria bacterium]
MNNVIIFHGTGGTPNHFWFPYLKDNLPAEKFNVSIPRLPNPDKPDLKELLSFVLKKFKYNEDTILVGHSSGCPLILSILENIDKKISKSILVAGFYKPLDSNPNPILQDNYDWSKIRKHSKQFIYINSIDDPWGCNEEMGKVMQKKLGGDLIIRSDQGHMGSEKFNQPYKEFPIVKFFIEN